MVQSFGFAALEAKAPLLPFSFERRDPRPHDVTIQILYSGICHSYLFFVTTIGATASIRWFRGTKSLAG